MITVAKAQDAATRGAAATTAGAEATAAPGFECDPETKRRIVNRLKRARGQLDAVIDAAEREASCKEIVTQLSAVTHALNRAGFVIVATAMQACADGERTAAAERDGGDGVSEADGTGASSDGASRPGALTMDELEKIFLSLV
ncbi:metal-sensitive transcriptional regulator [Actinomyces procaprae]|uniref:metal-sensitive transcriptional regulator n=1 Tax=Actinomyces procaprae TaxID=2560010 RepID=UPI001FFB503C|nr:metal-sensitive transcriptional regulator [Actinomyces procaprae]